MRIEERDFKQKFLPLHPRLYRVALLILGNSEDAEDIVQDLYCKLWDRRGELTKVKNAEAFSVRMLKNSCFDFIRIDKSKRKTEIDESVCAANQSPEMILIWREQINELNFVIKQLPENQQELMRLRALENNSFAEIEEKTGLSQINIRVLLSRARKTIRDRLRIQKNGK